MHKRYEFRKHFIIDNDLLDFEVMPEAQKKLFKISYDFESSEAKRICTKADTVKKYGSTDWNSLNSVIKDLVIDLKFRGDYTPKVRETIQKSIAENDLATFSKHIKDSQLWSRVPADRFNRRVKHLVSTSKP